MYMFHTHDETSIYNFKEKKHNTESGCILVSLYMFFKHDEINYYSLNAIILLTLSLNQNVSILYHQ